MFDKLSVSSGSYLLSWHLEEESGNDRRGLVVQHRQTFLYPSGAVCVWIWVFEHVFFHLHRKPLIFLPFRPCFFFVVVVFRSYWDITKSFLGCLPGTSVELYNHSLRAETVILILGCPSLRSVCFSPCVLCQVLAPLWFSVPPPDGTEAPALHQVSVCARSLCTPHLCLQEQVWEVCFMLESPSVCLCMHTGLRQRNVLHFWLNRSSLIAELFMCVCLCVSGPTRTSTSSLVQSCCVVMLMCLGVCQTQQPRRLQLESNPRFSSSSHTCWIQRRRRRASSTNTGGRYLAHSDTSRVNLHSGQLDL